jgi:hypothetical protein
MTSAKYGARALLGAAWLVLAGCAGDEPTRSQNTPTPNAMPLSCVPNVPRACPCIGQGIGQPMGTQACNPTGNGYSACTGCPPPLVQSVAGAGGVAGTAPGAAGSSGAAGGSSGSAGRAPMTSGAGGSSATDGGVDSGSEPTPTSGAVRGISCGVGLPTLCEIGKQKCCVRSLETDTCIEASAMCDCELQNCTTMETHCDGPEDCESGQVCCGTLAQNGAGYDDFVCAAQCQGTGQQRVACHEGETMCPSGLTCANSQLLTNVQICIDPATIEQ